MTINKSCFLNKSLSNFNSNVKILKTTLQSFLIIFYIQAKYLEKISEAIPPYSYILTVQATDADDGKNAVQMFSLKGTGANDFLIDSTTGNYNEDNFLFLKFIFKNVLTT